MKAFTIVFVLAVSAACGLCVACYVGAILTAYGR